MIKHYEIYYIYLNIININLNVYRAQSPSQNLRFPPLRSESSPLREVTRQNVVSTPHSSSRRDASECRESLMSKIKKLSQELQKFKLPSGHCRIEISRNNIFEVRNHIWNNSYLDNKAINSDILMLSLLLNVLLYLFSFKHFYNLFFWEFG